MQLEPVPHRAPEREIIDDQRRGHAREEGVERGQHEIGVPALAFGGNANPGGDAAQVGGALHMEQRADQRGVAHRHRQLANGAELEQRADAALIALPAAHRAVGIEKVDREAVLPEAGEAQGERLGKGRPPVDRRGDCPEIAGTEAVLRSRTVESFRVPDQLVHPLPSVHQQARAKWLTGNARLGMCRGHDAREQRGKRDAEQPAGKGANHDGVATPVGQRRRK